MSKQWRWFSAGILGGVAIVLIPMGVIILRYGDEIYRTWTVFEFVPACEEYEDPVVEERFDFYRSVEGQPTTEFWQIATEHIRKYRGFATDAWPSVAVKNERIVVAARELIDTWGPFNEYNEPTDQERLFHAISAVAAEEILRRREVDGRITEQSLEPFRVHRWRSNMRELPHADECGFMEELIMKGGRFASE